MYSLIGVKVCLSALNVHSRALQRTVWHGHAPREQCNFMLAKVGVGRSNRLTRSILPRRRKPRFAGAFVRFGAVDIAGCGSSENSRSYRRVTRCNAH